MNKTKWAILTVITAGMVFQFGSCGFLGVLGTALALSLLNII